MACYLLDFDLNGADSIAHLIPNKVVHMECDSFITFEGYFKELLPKVGPDDLVIMDTISKAADTTRGDMKLGVDPGEALWDKRGLYLGGDKNYLTVYEAAGQFIMRRLRNLRARGARIITTAHEDEQDDKTTLMKLRAPAVNEALYKSLMGSSSDVLRLRQTTEDMDLGGGKVLPAYSRVLELRPDGEAIIKTHVAPDRNKEMPRRILHPTLPKLYKTLGKRPTWLVLYGPPGAGKTTLATSEDQNA
jgi:hypothetical protein